MSEDANKSAIIEMTAEIVSAYVGQNRLASADLPALIQTVHGALNGIGQDPAPVTAEQAKPAVSIKKSITPDYLISLEDGKQYKSLKRHLRTKYDMTPEDYRAKWGLPKDYPMVAPNYAASRSALAKSMGLGRGGAATSRAKGKAKPGPKAKAAAPK